MSGLIPHSEDGVPAMGTPRGHVHGQSVWQRGLCVPVPPWGPHRGGWSSPGWMMGTPGSRSSPPADSKRLVTPAAKVVSSTEAGTMFRC